MDVPEPRAAYSGRRLHAAVCGQYFHQGSRYRARFGTQGIVPVAADRDCAPDVPGGRGGRLRRRRRFGGREDFPRYRLAEYGQGMNMRPVLGCIADDFTGATDLAGMLVRAGMRTVQMIGVPHEPLPADIDAVVVALKSRTAPAGDAVAESLAALRWLQNAGCRQFYFKYCSTFDSTDRGNIGPVTDALMSALDTDFTIACPAFPENRRTIFNGYLFVGDMLLNESGMQ